MKLQTFITVLLLAGAGIAIYLVVTDHSQKPTPDIIVSEPLPNELFGFLEGSKEAPLTIYKFFDYSCQYCKQYAGQLSALLNKYNLQFNIIHIPLPFGNDSNPFFQAAAISSCEYSTRSTMDAHYFFYTHQDNLEQELHSDLSNILSQTTEDNIHHIEECLKNSDYEEWIYDNRSAAQQIGLASVPALLIDNNIYIGSYPENQLRLIINFYLAR